jgi:hypothetical protein
LHKNKGQSPIFVLSKHKKGGLTMVTKTVAIYVFFDDILKSMNHKEPENRRISDAEVSTVILIGAMYFGGNMETAMNFVRCTGLIPNMLSKSRFNRRMHGIGELVAELFFHIGETVKSLNINHIYCIDSFPMAVCHNIRIPNCHIVKGKEYRGYNASKRTYFYGFKVHVTVTADGIPVEYSFTAGSIHDLDGFGQMPLNLPQGSEIMADSAYTDYDTEEMLADNGINLWATRKNNSKRPHGPCREYLISAHGKRVETVFSDIAKFMPKSIHAVTEEGFIIKLIAFIWAFTFNSLHKL